MKKISIIIPVYNVEEYVAECLDSVLNQDFKEYEIICVDDVSTDNSMEIVERYSKENPIIKIVRHSENRGLSAARNTGLKCAEGEYIFFVDSDDMIVDGALDELYETVKKNNLDVLFFNYSELCEEELTSMESKKTGKLINFEGIHTGQELFCLFQENNIKKIPSWRQLYRREFLNENNIIFLDGILHEDQLFTFECAMKANRVMDTNSEYYIYRRRANSIMNTMNYQRMQSLYRILIAIFNIWNKNHYSDRVNKAISNYFSSLYKRYETMKSYFHDYQELETGTYAEKSVFKLLHKGAAPQYVTLSDEQLKNLTGQEVIIYGAGVAASEIIQCINARKIPIKAVVVTEKSVNAQSICNIKIQEIHEYAEQRESVTLIIAAIEKNRASMIETAKKIGYKNIVEVEDVNSNQGLLEGERSGYFNCDSII